MSLLETGLPIRLSGEITVPRRDGALSNRLLLPLAERDAADRILAVCFLPPPPAWPQADEAEMTAPSPRDVIIPCEPAELQFIGWRLRSGPAHR